MTPLKDRLQDQVKDRAPASPESAATFPPRQRASRERLIVALDFPRAEAALALVDRLEGACQWFKVGLELYLAENGVIVSELRRRGHSVFLDLKLHDIPNTVASAVRSVSHLGAGMLTVHAAGGPHMLSAAVDAARESTDPPLLLAVTVLTSMDPSQLVATGILAEPAAQVEKLAKLAVACGIPGLVSSAEEVAALRRALGDDIVLVTPGIRLPGDEVGDQKRVATPEAAIAAGASYLVVGRPITRAADPGSAARSILSAMELGATHRNA